LMMMMMLFLVVVGIFQVQEAQGLPCTSYPQQFCPYGYYCGSVCIDCPLTMGQAGYSNITGAWCMINPTSNTPYLMTSTPSTGTGVCMSTNFLSALPGCYNECVEMYACNSNNDCNKLIKNGKGAWPCQNTVNNYNGSAGIYCCLSGNCFNVVNGACANGAFPGVQCNYASWVDMQISGSPTITWGSFGHTCISDSWFLAQYAETTSSVGGAAPTIPLASAIALIFTAFVLGIILAYAVYKVGKRNSNQPVESSSKQQLELSQRSNEDPLVSRANEDAVPINTNV